MSSRRLKELGWWIGLAAMALQIALSPVLSSRALAMDLDPLAAAAICATAPDGSSRTPMPADHAGHCLDCCAVHCAVQIGPALSPAMFDFAAPRVPGASYRLAAVAPLPRGPPRHDFSARGPPIFA